MLDLYVELCRRCTAYKKSIGAIDDAVDIDVIGVPVLCAGGYEDDLYPKAKEDFDWQNESLRSLERSIGLSSPSIDAPLALIVSDFLEGATWFTDSVYGAPTLFELSESSISQTQKYARESDPWATLCQIHLMHLAIESLYNGIQVLERRVGPLQIDQGSKEKAIRLFRDQADACRHAYATWAKLTGRGPSIGDLDDIHERKINRPVSGSSN